MPNRPRYRTPRNYARLENRYTKLMEIFALPDDEARRQALSDFLDEIATKRQEELQEPESASASLDVTRDDEPPLDELFTDATNQQQGWGYILPGRSSQPAFPKRSREELKQLIVTFLDLLIAGKREVN